MTLEQWLDVQYSKACYVACMDRALIAHARELFASQVNNALGCNGHEMLLRHAGTKSSVRDDSRCRAVSSAAGCAGGQTPPGRRV